jgi:membrane protease YdiL (CAAX protease family)
LVNVSSELDSDLQSRVDSFAYDDGGPRREPTKETMTAKSGSARGKKWPLGFFLLVLALSLPLWAVGTATEAQLLPRLPASAGMFYVPVTAALILDYQERRTAGVVTLLKRSFDAERITAKGWYIPIFLLMPCATLATYGVMWVLGRSLAAPQYSLLAALAMFVAFFFAALCEELGWTGYVTDPLQERWGALSAAIFLGLVWAVWHYVPLMQAHRSASWIVWWTLYTVALRVLVVWLYNNTGNSVFAAALFHAFTNVSGIIFAAYYDPHITGTIIAAVAAIVIVVWGPRTLAGYRRM